LVEKIAAESGCYDLYSLSTDLVMDLDDLLPVVEAGELLGSLVVREGDLELTPLGRAYADASILARKEFVAGRIL
jgi:NitT/TauT family transport system ATP-binding protein